MFLLLLSSCCCDLYGYQENWQMRALEELMKQKDYRHAQLTNDISSLENQLAKLSIVELSNKASYNQQKLVCQLYHDHVYNSKTKTNFYIPLRWVFSWHFIFRCVNLLQTT